MDDTSWDQEFEGELKFPLHLLQYSQSIKSETEAAKQLSQVINELRSILISQTLISIDINVIKQACLLVAASVQQDDEFLNCETYKQHAEHLASDIRPSSIFETLNLANKLLLEMKPQLRT